MNVQRNPKTFNRLFTLFINMGEERLGRHLTAEEINKLRPSIAKKCENINKKDIVREIYNLEKSKMEREHGPLGIRDKLNLRKQISNFTNCPVKYTSSSKDLAKLVANNFANIHENDSLIRNPNLKLISPEILKQEKRKLRDSYINDKFHYKAPLSLSDKLKRWTALGLVGISAMGIMGQEILFKDQPTISKEDTSISDASNNETYTPKSYVESQLQTTTNLEHFKSVVAQEYNQYHFTEEIDSNEITVISNSHNFLFRVNNSDYEYYIAPGDHPDVVENILKTNYSNVEKITNTNSNINVITVSDKKDTFLGGSAFLNNRYIPVITDGNYIMNNIEDFYKNPTSLLSPENIECVGNFITKLCASHCFDALLVDSYNYADCIADYVEKNPDNAYSREVMSVVKDPLLYPRYNSEQFSNEELLQNYREKQAREYEIDF